jgi:regulatory protein
VAFAFGAASRAMAPGQTLKSRALRHLAQREHSRGELQQKLERHLQAAARLAKATASAVAADDADAADVDQAAAAGKRVASAATRSAAEPSYRVEPLDADSQAASDLAAINQVLDDLERRGFLSDTRTAESLLNSSAKRYGSIRLRQTMKARGLQAELVTATVARARDTELARATELWRKRFGAPGVDAKERAKQARFLLSRGFPSDVVFRVLRQDKSDD